MNMRSAYRRVSFGFIALILLTATIVMQGVVSAQGPTSGSGLRVSPTRSELTLDREGTSEVKHTVRNVMQSPVTVEPVLNDFESDGVTGQPRMIGDPNEKSVYSLREFISLPEKFDLQPDEEREITISVEVPSNAAPGAYFGSVLYRASPLGSSGTGQVALVASVGSLILLEVPGDIREQIAVQDVSAYIEDSAGSFFTKKPNFIGVLIENQGNSFSRPFGKVSVKDWQGNEIFAYDMNGVDPKANILPDSTRLFKERFMNVEKKTVNGVEETTETSPIKWPGRYSIVSNLSHGTTGEVYTVSTTFWFIPTWIIITLVVLVVALIGGGYFMFRRYATRSTKR